MLRRRTMLWGAPMILEVIVACVGPSSGLRADEGLALLPGEIKLTGSQAYQSLLVEESRNGQYVGQVVEGLTFESSNPQVVAIEDGVARPVGNGQATITAKIGARSSTAAVTVAGMDQPFRWSFRNHVESVLAKAGCSSGACHGAQAGKNGFKLSLRGYDPDGDFNTITRQARGRRIVPSDPGRSLILTKPTGAVPHKGGLRFRVNSLEYRVLADWIAAGTPPPTPGDPRLERLEILPGSSVLKPEAKQQLIVLAHFNDGHTEDVTRWAKFTSTNESVGQVGELGQVKVVGYGEGAITAWYLSRVVTATISSPYPTPVAAEVIAHAERRNFIDDEVLAKLASLSIPPSAAAGDSEFLRRAYIDTIGMLPTADEARAFLGDPSPDKRDRLIESLLERPEFVDYWAYKWSDLLLVNSEKLRPPAMWAYYTWIRNQVEANTPWDEFARQVVTATGSTLENGATNYFVLHQDAPDVTETTTVAFLGMSVNCARCHNHPLEKWTNNQYYAMANLFARVKLKAAPGDGNTIVFAATEGELIQPLTGKPQVPTPLDGQPTPLESPDDRRQHLARWLTSPDNPYFSRAIVNRIWANFFGVGLVEMVDDMRLTNPASNEKLLNAAAKLLVDNRFDLKSLMRAILQSKTYQRSSNPLPENKGDARFYSRYYPKRLMAEVLLDAMSQVTAAPTQFGDYPLGWRAVQLPDSNVNSYFLKTFGRPERVVTCECERTAEPTMVQVLHISNGDSLNNKLQAKGNRLEQLLAANTPDDRLVEELYLGALARRPTEDEKAKLLAVLAEPGSDKRQVLEDLYWSVLSSREFLFNH
ncbi:MAG TPA: DUF1549 and DUF1553 domain-containing protein [Pirellulales bacterium]|nr:DUF1549 and DUF1553 domain-containing protein [Pirellulales bacterium]